MSFFFCQIYVKYIVLRDNDITSAEVLETLSDVIMLDLSYNDIGNLTPLNALQNLTDLYLDGNKNITGILDNNVIYLSIKDCAMNGFDISKLKQLRSIDISFNSINVIDLLQSKEENLYISGENVKLTKEQFEYLLSQRQFYNDRHKYIDFYSPIITMNVLVPYNLDSIEWLKKYDDIQVDNGIIVDNYLDIVDNTSPITLSLNSKVGNGLYNPIIILNAS